MKLVVAHTGARRGYAVPAILETAGMLERFYTDICADVGLGRVVTSATKFGLGGKQARRLASRRLPANIISKSRTFTAPNLRYYCSAWRSKSRVEAFLDNVRWQCALGDRMARAGFGEGVRAGKRAAEGELRAGDVHRRAARAERERAGERTRAGRGRHGATVHREALGGRVGDITKIERRAARDRRAAGGRAERVVRRDGECAGVHRRRTGVGVGGG